MHIFFRAMYISTLLRQLKRQQVARHQKKRQEGRIRKSKSDDDVLRPLERKNRYLQKSLDKEKSIKEKYYELWRKSEREKTKLITFRHVFSGAAFLKDIKTASNKGIMQINPE